MANYVLSIEDIDEMLDNGDIKCVDDITEKTNLYSKDTEGLMVLILMMWTYESIEVM